MAALLIQCAAAVEVSPVPRQIMPESASVLLKQCVHNFQSDSPYYPEAKASAEKTLDLWCKAPWPVLNQLQRVHVLVPEARKKDERIYFLDRRDYNAWQLPDNRLLMDDFSERAVRPHETLKPMDYAAELREMAAYSELCAKAKTTANYNTPKSFEFHHMAAFHDDSRYYFRPIDSFHHAYAAAALGFPELVPPLVYNSMAPYGQLKQNVFDHLARAKMHSAMNAFANGSTRGELLRDMLETHLLYPESECDWEVLSLIAPLQHELKEGEPPYLLKPQSERSAEERIRALIWEFRDICGSQMGAPGYPDVFQNLFNHGQRQSPAQAVVDIGPSAVPYLIEALNDYTPTRTVGYRWNSRLLRRMDVAINVLNTLTGCDFYTPASTSGDLHNDKPERREAAVARVKKWWAESQGLTQAQMLRKQIALSLNDGLRKDIGELWLLGNLEGPEYVIGELEKLTTSEASYHAKEALNALDPRRPIVDKLKRFQFGSNKEWEYADIFEYGNKATYQEILKRFESNGILDVSSNWELGAQGELAAQHGGNWALPILGKLLSHTELRSYASGGYIANFQTVSDAEQIMPWFEKLTGKSFGYDINAARPERLLAVKKAQDWWMDEGQTILKQKIGEEHLPGSGTNEQFLSDEEIDRRVILLSGDDSTARRLALEGMGCALSWKTQRALLTALSKEHDGPTRLSILKALGRYAGLWAVPELAQVMDREGALQERLLAARAMRSPIRDKSTEIWWKRLESRDAGLSVARRLAADRKTPLDLRQASLDILMDWDSTRDSALLLSLKDDPDLIPYIKFQTYIKAWRK